jgi:hypothetical protein
VDLELDVFEESAAGVRDRELDRRLLEGSNALEERREPLATLGPPLLQLVAVFLDGAGLFVARSAEYLANCFGCVKADGQAREPGFCSAGGSQPDLHGCVEELLQLVDIPPSAADGVVV